MTVCVISRHIMLTAHARVRPSVHSSSTCDHQRRKYDASCLRLAPAANCSLQGTLPQQDVKYCDISVYVGVCPSASISQKPGCLHYLQVFVPNFRRTLPAAEAWSSSSGVAMRYVHPVLWMMSCHCYAHNEVRQA